MKKQLKVFVKNNPKIKSMIMSIHNHILGCNKIKIPLKNNVNIGIIIMKKTNITIKGINNTIIIKDSSRLEKCKLFICGNNNKIIISEKVYLNSTELWIEDDNNQISIGENTSIQGTTQIAAIEGTRVDIGNDCMFSSNIVFRTGDSHSIIDLKGKRLNASEDIFIGNHVWIGTKVIFLKGVQIANNCIVGAGSLVTKKFTDENIILAGSPAKIVKYKINWLKERI